MKRPFDELEATDRRRLLVRAGLRIASTLVVLILLYAFVPVDPYSGPGAFPGMIVGLLVLATLVWLQLGWILRAEQPAVRAGEAIVFVTSVFITLFALTHLALSADDPASYSEPLNRIGALYYTVSIISTVGFGDISARSDAARLLVTIQITLGIVAVAGFVRVASLAAQAARRERAPDHGDGGG